MAENDSKEMQGLLRQAARPGEILTTLGEIEISSEEDSPLVRLVVRNLRTGGPMFARAEVVAKNTTAPYDGVLTVCGPGFTEFPLDYPCLTGGVRRAVREDFAEDTED